MGDKGNTLMFRDHIYRITSCFFSGNNYVRSGKCQGKVREFYAPKYVGTLIIFSEFVLTFSSYFSLAAYCQHIINVEKGGRVQLKTIDLGGVGSLFGRTSYSCIWQLRIPRELQKHDMKAYLQFLDASFKGKAKILGIFHWISECATMQSIP